MTGELDRLERGVEREMRVLRALTAEQPPSECVGRVQAVVIAESRRVARRLRLLGVLRTGLGAAAALLLAFGWAATSPQTAPWTGSDPETVLRDWSAALAESSNRLTSLLAADLVPDGSDDSELDDLFRSYDESLSRFESL